jgi:hypothetical protein
MNTMAASSSANRCGSAQFRGEDGSFILEEHIRNRAVEQGQSFGRDPRDSGNETFIGRIQVDWVGLGGLGWTWWTGLTGLDWFDWVGLV